MAIIDPGLVSRLIGRALSHGGEFADVYVQRRRSLFLDLDDGELRSSNSSRSFGVGIRVVSGAATAFSYCEELEEDALLQCADTVSQAARLQAADSVVSRPLERGKIAGHVEPEGVPIAQRPVDARYRVLLRAHQRAQGQDGLQHIQGSYADLDEDVLIANSEGLWIEDRRTLTRLNLRVIIDDDGRRRTGSYGGGSRRGLNYYDDELTPEQIADEAVRVAKSQIGAVSAPVGEQTVVLGPASSGILLHEAVGHGLEADFIRKRTSLFTDRVGDKVASELCTVIDDGTIAGRRGSLNVDDEGTPTSENILIEDGRLVGYLTDRQNASLLELERTGNARRQSFRHLPMPRMTNTFLRAGDDDPEDIVKGVSSGIYCRTFGGGQVDIANGNFVFEVREGYLIEDGKITAPVQGATLVGNGPDTLQKISRVGGDGELDSGIYTCGKAGQSVPVCVGLPTCRIDGVTVGGAGA